MGLGEDDNKAEHGQSSSRAFGLRGHSPRNPLERRPLFPGPQPSEPLERRRPCSQAQAQVDDMANDLLDKIPDWLKSLWHMENELRNAARNGLILRKDEASAHLAEARRHLEQAMNEAKGIEPPNGPQTPLRKEGEI